MPVDAATPDGTTALHVAAAAHYAERIVPVLLEAGADPARVRADGATAASIAASLGRGDVGALLRAP